ncbi:MAG: amidophosphoribosyltransferase [Puniceicoccales bacterium]|jgi:amidophosphoribosyltransferase|nr:amidophosphoribosyltransferase [Puniceicoccales bacterium]
MSDHLAHECGIAFVRLFKGHRYYEEKYGTPLYGFNQLFLLMEKQHNRGQDGAGIGCVKLNMPHGQAFMFRDRDPSSQALTNIFTRQLEAYSQKVASDTIIPEFPQSIKAHFDFGGEVLLGHLRYGTSGNLDGAACHPFFRKSIWATRNLMVAGNFNITNSSSLNESLIQRGAHPIFSTDTQSVLEEIGFWLDEEHTKLYRELRDEQKLSGAEIPPVISQRLDVAKILRMASRNWDGGYVIIGLIGNGDAFIFRDPNGIRPCHYIFNDEVFAAASERAALMTIFNTTCEDIREIPPGYAMIIKSDGTHTLDEIIPSCAPRHCSFERIYFSRGNDPEIYAERKALGAALAGKVLESIERDFEHSVFSFIPNTAEIAFYGLIHEIYRHWREDTREAILAAAANGTLDRPLLDKLLFANWPRSEKVAHKDIKLRTFISAEKNRTKLASHVYDISYGTVSRGDNLVVVDDSIVRGTTLRQSIIRILSRPNPQRIIIASTAPQIRYPDCYGIDMSEMGQFLIFQSAVALCRETGKSDLLREVYEACCSQAGKPPAQMRNYVRRIYDEFTEEQLSKRAAELVRPSPSTWQGELKLVFQSINNLHKACPTSLGDWYFTGEYPTPGGYATLNRAYINFHDKRSGRGYEDMPTPFSPTMHHT